MTKVRVVVVDDHPVLRDGLRALIDAQSGMCVVGEAADGVEACRLAGELSPDVVVMDLSMPKLGGPEATERIRKACPEVKVLALTAHEDGGYVQLMLSAGASGYVLKRAAAEDLIRAIQVIAAGALYLDPDMAGHVLPYVQRREAEPSTRNELSDREAQVLKLMAQGYSTKEISARLSVGTRTVETYKSRAMDKLRLKSRAEVVRYALQRGWLKNP